MSSGTRVGVDLRGGRPGRPGDELVARPGRDQRAPGRRGRDPARLGSGPGDPAPARVDRHGTAELSHLTPPTVGEAGATDPSRTSMDGPCEPYRPGRSWRAAAAVRGHQDGDSVHEIRSEALHPDAAPLP